MHRVGTRKGLGFYNLQKARFNATGIFSVTVLKKSKGKIQGILFKYKEGCGPWEIHQSRKFPNTRGSTRLKNNLQVIENPNTLDLLYPVKLHSLTQLHMAK